MGKNTGVAVAKVQAYTDGGCRGNPGGVGGWGVLLRYGDHEKELSGAVLDTTNNRMELTAAIEALQALRRPSEVELVTDSQYVKKGMTEWLPGWKQRRWRTASGQPVKNQALWEALDQLCQVHQVQWFWVRGHSGHPENERADRLANEAMDALLAQERARGG